MVIAQYSGLKGAYPDFAFVTGFCFLFMRQSLYIKGSQAEPGNQVVKSLKTRTKIEGIHQQYKSMKANFPISIF